MCLSKVKILIAKVLFVVSALGAVIIIPVTVYGTGDSSRYKAVELFNTPFVINEKRTFEQFKKQLGVNRPNSYLAKVANFFCKKTQGQNEIPLEEMNVELTSSEFYDDIDPNEPYVDIEKTKKNQEDTTDGQQPIVPVANVPQQVGLEGVGVGHNPAPLLFPDNVQQQGEDGDAVRRSPIHVYVPQDHQEQQDHLQIDIEEHVPPVGKDGAVGVPPAREDGAVVAPPAGRVPAPPPAPPIEEAEEEHAPPAEAIAPQEKVAQVARVTAALAEELLQKQKETVRNIALALNEIIILSHEFANSSIDLRLSDLKHLNNLSPPAAGDEDNIVPKNMWVSGTIGILDENQQLRCRCPRPAVLTY